MRDEDAIEGEEVRARVVPVAGVALLGRSAMSPRAALHVDDGTIELAGEVGMRGIQHPERTIPVDLVGSQSEEQTWVMARVKGDM